MDDVKILYTNGDSWTAGDIVDPIRFKDEPWHVMHPDNDQYRLFAGKTPKQVYTDYQKFGLIKPVKI